MPIFLHDHPDFPQLIQIVADEMGIEPTLVEKDYCIMHVLYGLKQLGLAFELKGGTSLSKGFGIIDRFSEDIDIHIHPPAALNVESNPAKRKEHHIQSRKDYYNWLAQNLLIAGIVQAVRDTAFDDTDAYRSGGIRLMYSSHTGGLAGVKDGILLEVGFDDVAPNQLRTISSWAWERAQSAGVPDLIDNRAVDIACYNPGYTFVEKLQTIATKFRKEQEGAAKQLNYMRQYYDVYCLLNNPDVQAFIGTPEYQAHKLKRFPKTDLMVPLAANEAFLLSDPAIRADFTQRYQSTRTLYYKGQPEFALVLRAIQTELSRL